jgi:hypothetical protein
VSEILVIAWSSVGADHRRQEAVAGRWTCSWGIESTRGEVDPHPLQRGGGAADSEAGAGVVGCNRRRWLGGLRGGPGAVRSNHWRRRGELGGGGHHRRLKSEAGALRSTRSGDLACNRRRHAMGNRMRGRGVIESDTRARSVGDGLGGRGGQYGLCSASMSNEHIFISL